MDWRTILGLPQPDTAEAAAARVRLAEEAVETLASRATAAGVQVEITRRALGADALNASDGEASKAAQSAHRLAVERCTALQEALAGAETHLETLKFRAKHRAAFELWAHAEARAAALVTAGQEFDAALAKAGALWQTVESQATELAGMHLRLSEMRKGLAEDLPIDLSVDFDIGWQVGPTKLNLAWDQARETAGLPGERVPGRSTGTAASFARDVVSYLDSRNPLRAVAPAEPEPAEA